MRKIRCMFALVTILSFCPVYLSAVYADSLASLVGSNGTIQQGDKLFSDFSFVPGNPNIGTSGAGSFSPATAGDIVIQGITVSGQNGLQFTGPFFESSTPALQSFILYQIEFNATVTDPAFLIHDLHESFSGTSSGLNYATITTRTAASSFCGLGCIQLQGGGGGLFSADGSVLLPSNVSTAHVIEWFAFTPVTGSGGDQTGSVTVPSIDVTFSQTPASVPEPATMLLLGFGLMGLAGVRRKFRK